MTNSTNTRAALIVKRRNALEAFIAARDCYEAYGNSMPTEEVAPGIHRATAAWVTAVQNLWATREALDAIDAQLD